VPLPELVGPFAGKLREWAAMEVAPGRLMPWLPHTIRHHSPVFANISWIDIYLSFRSLYTFVPIRYNPRFKRG
jgi:hypothetical protein